MVCILLNLTCAFRKSWISFTIYFTYILNLVDIKVICTVYTFPNSTAITVKTFHLANPVR